jgi:hypothetical protein
VLPSCPHDAEGRATTCHEELYPDCATGLRFPGWSLCHLSCSSPSAAARAGWPIPELAKGLGAGLKELREGISNGDEAEAKMLQSEEARSGTRTGSMGAPGGARADQRGL